METRVAGAGLGIGEDSVGNHATVVGIASQGDGRAEGHVLTRSDRVFSGTGGTHKAQMGTARVDPQNRASPLPAGEAPETVTPDGPVGTVGVVYSNPQAMFASKSSWPYQR